MTLPNDSIVVTPGSGATVASHLISSKEYEVWVRAEENGALISDVVGLWSVNFLTVPSTPQNAISILNADAALIVDVLAVWIQPVGGTGGGFFRDDPYSLTRITAHSGGTSLTPSKVDTTTGALDADITVLGQATSATTTGEAFGTYQNGGNSAGPDAGPYGRVYLWNWKIEGVPIVLRQDEGVLAVERGAGGALTYGSYVGITFRVR